MHHPIAMGAIAAGYALGAFAWIYLMGGFTAPRRGNRLSFCAEIAVTVFWPVAMAITGLIIIRDRLP